MLANDADAVHMLIKCVIMPEDDPLKGWNMQRRLSIINNEYCCVDGQFTYNLITNHRSMVPHQAPGSNVLYQKVLFPLKFLKITKWKTMTVLCNAYLSKKGFSCMVRSWRSGLRRRDNGLLLTQTLNTLHQWAQQFIPLYFSRTVNK
jgi:hypothetical protein